MNRTLSESQIDAALEVLYEGLVALRMAAMAGDAGTCEAISDALHNLPDLVRVGDKRGWTVERFVYLFLSPLAERKPEAAAWAAKLRNA
ncbi:MAG TPA: hypothetical protein VGQ83_00435 [Polyangia bacterium]|jgi:hypothetical protein